MLFVSALYSRYFATSPGIAPIQAGKAKRRCTTVWSCYYRFRRFALQCCIDAVHINAIPFKLPHRHDFILMKA